MKNLIYYITVTINPALRLCTKLQLDCVQVLQIGTLVTRCRASLPLVYQFCSTTDLQSIIKKISQTFFRMTHIRSHMLRSFQNHTIAYKIAQVVLSAYLQYSIYIFSDIT